MKDIGVVGGTSDPCRAIEVKRTGERGKGENGVGEINGEGI